MTTNSPTPSAPCERCGKKNPADVHTCTPTLSAGESALSSHHGGMQPKNKADDSPAVQSSEMQKLIAILEKRNGDMYELYPAECRELAAYIRSLETENRDMHSEIAHLKANED